MSSIASRIETKQKTLHKISDMMHNSAVHLQVWKVKSALPSREIAGNSGLHRQAWGTEHASRKRLC